MKSGWQNIELSKVLSKCNTLTELHPAAEYKEVTVRLWGRGVGLRRITKGAEMKTSKRVQVRKGQFIISRIDARHGACGLIPDNLHGAVVSNDFPVFGIDKDRIYPEYFEWLSKTNAFIEACRAVSEGTTNRVRLLVDKFLRLKIPFPSLSEQRRIVEKIEQLTSKIEEARQTKRTIDQETKAMLRSAFADLKEGAPLESMAEVSPVVRRPVKLEIGEKYPELGIRSFGKGAFHKPALDYLSVGTKKLYWIKPGDLIFHNVFAWEGAITVARNVDSGRVGSHRFITCVPKPSIITVQFLCFYFLTPEGLQKIGEASPGGAGRNRTLGLKKLLQIQVPVTALSKQLWFNKMLAKVDRFRALQNRTDAELNTLLLSILDKAFKGEL